MMNWLLLLVPVAIGLHFLRPEAQTAIFLTSAIAIIPLAGWLGHATEHVAAKAGEGVGGLLNATFGNAAELIIAIAALRGGLYDVVKASLTGSIIGNILLVTGAAVFAGGLRYKEQRFNPTAARSQASMMTLAVIALIAPAAYHWLAEGTSPGLKKSNEAGLSLEISLVLLATYGANLLFSLRTHKQLFTGETEEEAITGERWTMRKSLLVLAAATGMIAWVSEILVGSVEHAAKAFGMTQVFVGVIVVAIVGNAAEHSTAIVAAVKNRMDLSLSIAIGSSVQIALFVAPLVVLLSRAIGPAPMDLVFTPAEVLAIGLAVIITGQITGDGESNWLEGVQLLAVYLILAIVFFFLPETAGGH